ncbi:hypothetical protein FGSG_13186 [Fusarium graminearum PH-1]|uniref:Transcription factor domain-containing protein n=1 Tax=Gibberella zeae (strain ATCC MYA-4620 / CBS 123657 / FGSC 9075 / NRRL 31084 / PH-1) TaxID=229533 RepID=I1S8K8_GIBZE|nr:hypothetical protein FGSG_13186 [Fusarium graminearum PH-1]ESU13969.1 hypothetical protein FGSG_13186 [Fusarium graminearum PH-1]|eukprot:XP_011327476.1 hypothetical protein FGSG_13186 [Fusarium graminearum PH-1]
MTCSSPQPAANMFELVGSSSPDEAPHRQHQATQRQHGISHDSQRQRDQTWDQDMETTTMDLADGNLIGPITVGNGAITTACLTGLDSPYSVLGCSLLDPFDTLCESPERLRQLLRHRMNPNYLFFSTIKLICSVALVKSAGEPLFRVDQQTNLVLFQGFQVEDAPLSFLADKTLFHALSLLLTLEANNHVPNYETLHHRGQVLESLRSDLLHSRDGVPSLQIITAILMLISYEYRVQDTQSNPDTAAMHIRGLQRIMHHPDILASGYSPQRIQQIQRALSWQDIICSLATGTPRLLPLEGNDAFDRLRENKLYHSCFVLPEGLAPYTGSWPETSLAVFEDLNAMCQLVDRIHGQNASSADLNDEDINTIPAPVPLMEDLDDEGYPLYNNQANLEIRLVDLLSQTKADSQNQDDLIYRACLFAAYLCTYRLSAGLWEGHFVPEKCVTEILKCIADFSRHVSPWKLAPDISFWLLHVAGGLTKSQLNKKQAALLMQRYRPFYSISYNLDWEVVEMKLRKFVWCEHTMKSNLYRFWQECQNAYCQRS